MAKDLKQYPLVIAPKESESMSCEQLGILIRKKDKSVLVIDVRDPNIDYNGGHIARSINLPYDTFDDSLSQIIDIIVSMDNQISKIIIHCMESKHRGPRCCNKLTDFKKEIMKIRDDDKKQEKKEQEKKDAGSVGSVGSVTELIKKYDNLPDILGEIKVYLLNGGYQEYMNKFHSNKGLIEDFNEKYWTQDDDGYFTHTLYDVKVNEKLVSNENDQHK